MVATNKPSVGLLAPKHLPKQHNPEQHNPELDIGD
jgi:hypothetical protein